MIEMRATSNRSIGFTAVSVLLALAMATPARAQEVTLPGNAASLREIHGDWTVVCALVSAPNVGKTKRCAFSQQQISQQTRQRALAIELRPENERVRGTLVLPFGLDLKSGITYQLDDGAESAVQHFRTCLPVGCVVDVAFDASTVASLRTGSALDIRASADGGQEMMLSVSLTGFSSAHDRAAALLQ